MLWIHKYYDKLKLRTRQAGNQQFGTVYQAQILLKKGRLASREHYKCSTGLFILAAEARLTTGCEMRDHAQLLNTAHRRKAIKSLLAVSETSSWPPAPPDRSVI